MFTYKDLVEKYDMFFIEPGERQHRNMLTLIFQQYICSPEGVIRYITPEEYEQPIEFETLMEIFEQIYEKGRIGGV